MQEVQTATALMAHTHTHTHLDKESEVGVEDLLRHHCIPFPTHTTRVDALLTLDTCVFVCMLAHLHVCKRACVCVYVGVSLVRVCVYV